MFGFTFGPKSVSVVEAHERVGTEGHCLLDVRTTEEVRDTAIIDARNIPLDHLEARAAELSQFASIHVICRSGGRSSMATNLLHSLGITQAENVSGGLIAWEAAGLPTK